MIHADRRYGVDSEYKPLKAVLLYKPGPEIEEIDEPGSVLYVNKINYKILSKEYDDIVSLYRKFNIAVYFIPHEKNKPKDERYVFNLMYTRDLLFMFPRGAIISRMAKDVRKREVEYAKRAMRRGNVPIVKIIEDEGFFEGADALWVNKRLVMVGVGNRTNKDGFLQVYNTLKLNGIKCIAVPAPKGVLHLLGAVQIVDVDLAFVRRSLVGLEIITLLVSVSLSLL